MTDWQSWIVALVVLLCIIRLGQGVFSFFRRTKQKENPCLHCPQECEIKHLYEQKRQECSAKQEKIGRNSKKNCCG